MAIIRLLHSADSCVELREKAVDVVIRDVGVDSLLVVLNVFLEIVH